jgi:photosystem II stability/assembly factor-like uncharacterized protein
MTMRSFTRLFLLAPCAALFFYASSCTSLEGKNAEGHEQEQEEELGEQPPVGVYKGTGVSYLLNVKEIGLLKSSGRITCLVIDRVDSNHLIAGASSGGLFASYNRGKSWAPIDDQLPSLYIRSACQNPLQTNTYYASCGMNILAGPSTTVYRPDIYKSTDGGHTFALIPATAGTFGSVIKVVCSPLNVSTVYALADNIGGSGLYRSTDGAQTFTKVYTSNIGVTDLEVLPNGTVLISIGTEIYRSATGNTGSFVQVANGTTGPNTFSNIDMAFCQSQPNNLFAVATGGTVGVGLFKSIDMGQTWSFVSTITSGQFTRTVGVKPDNPAMFFAGSVGLYVSLNSGGTLAFYGVGGVDWWSVNFDPQNANKVFMTLDQGVREVNLNPFNPNNNTAYVSHDSLLRTGQAYAGDYFVSGDRVIMGMQDLGTNLAYNYGVGERSVASGDGGACFYHKQDTTVCYGTYQNGNVFKKTSMQIPFPQPGFTQPLDIRNQMDANNDGTIDEGAFFISYFWMNNADGEQLYFPTRKRLWRTTNGGTLWTPVSAFYDDNGINSAEIHIDGNNKPNPIVYWSMKDTLWVKPDAKTSAAGNELKIKMPGLVKCVRKDPTNDSIVYITAFTAVSGARCWKSSNLFKPNVTWTDLTGDLPDQVALRCIEVNQYNKNEMVAGANGGIWVTSNGGAHWDRDVQLPNVNTLGMAVRPSDNRIFIFTFGRGAWAADFHTTNSAVQTVAEAGLLNIYPNPAQHTVNISLPALHNNSSIQVTGVDGRVQKAITNLHAITTINISDLAAGNYLVTLYEDGKRIRTGKLVKN